MILILGAGLTGLSTGCALGEREHLIVEQEKETGGLCRSFQVDGFTYDLTGHLLHLRDDKIRQFVDKLLPEDSWNFIQRRSWIYSTDACRCSRCLAWRGEGSEQPTFDPTPASGGAADIFHDRCVALRKARSGCPC